MPKVITSDGRTLEWHGLGICYCSECEELFNSVAAFDKHIRRESAGAEPEHDYSKLPRNAKGYFVTALYDGAHWDGSE